MSILERGGILDAPDFPDVRYGSLAEKGLTNTVLIGAAVLVAGAGLYLYTAPKYTAPKYTAPSDRNTSSSAKASVTAPVEMDCAQSGACCEW